MQEKSSPTETSKRKSFESSKKSTRRPGGASASSTRSSKRNGGGQKNLHQNKLRRRILPRGRKRSDKNNSNNSSKCNRLMRLNNSNINTCSSNISSSRQCNSSKASCSTTRRTWRRTCRCLLYSSHLLNKTHLTLHNSNNVHNHSNSSSRQAEQENRTGKSLRAFLTQCTPKQTLTYRSIPIRMSMSRRVRGMGIPREESGGASRVDWIERKTTARSETLHVLWMWIRK